VIGEIPKWLNRAKINCIDFGDDSSWPQYNTNQKILEASKHFLEFVSMDDDMYLLKESSKDDFKITRRLDGVLSYTGREKHLSHFQRVLRLTYFELQKRQKPHIYNFCTHAPRYYQSNKIHELAKEFALTDQDTGKLNLENLYCNYFLDTNQEPELIGDFRVGYWGTWKCQSISPANKILNHDEKGLLKNPWIYSLLVEQFPEKCAAESY
jgi:hypothetical protein